MTTPASLDKSVRSFRSPCSSGGAPTSDLAGFDNSHTHSETRLNPGVYPSDPQGHTLLVGTNERSLTVLDLGGVVQVGGINVTDPNHLDALADRLRLVAEKLRRHLNR